MPSTLIIDSPAYRNGYVKVKKISTIMTTETYTPKAKLVIELERTADFKKLVVEFNKTRAAQAPTKAA